MTSYGYTESQLGFSALRRWTKLRAVTMIAHPLISIVLHSESFGKPGLSKEISFGKVCGPIPHRASKVYGFVKNIKAHIETLQAQNRSAYM